MIGKAEWAQEKANPRVIVTSLKADDGEGRTLYEDRYCARARWKSAPCAGLPCPETQFAKATCGTIVIVL